MTLNVIWKTFKMSKSPQSQTQVWQIYQHVLSRVNNPSLKPLFVDFVVPHNTYYGISSYMNQVQLSFRVTNHEEKVIVENFVKEGLTPVDDVSFTLMENCKGRGKPVSIK